MNWPAGPRRRTVPGPASAAPAPRPASQHPGWTCSPAGEAAPSPRRWAAGCAISARTRALASRAGRSGIGGHGAQRGCDSRPPSRAALAIPPPRRPGRSPAQSRAVQQLVHQGTKPENRRHVLWTYVPAGGEVRVARLDHERGVAEDQLLALALEERRDVVQQRVGAVCAAAANSEPTSERDDSEPLHLQSSAKTGSACWAE